MKGFSLQGRAQGLQEKTFNRPKPRRGYPTRMTKAGPDNPPVSIYRGGEATSLKLDYLKREVRHSPSWEHQIVFREEKKKATVTRQLSSLTSGTKPRNRKKYFPVQKRRKGVPNLVQVRGKDSSEERAGVSFPGGISLGKPPQGEPALAQGKAPTLLQMTATKKM